jgi:imidazole glycerol-phosphate synthase subunit HisH
MRVTILDYGVGNLHSLAKAVVGSHAEVILETDPLRAIETDVLLLPGVGSFSAAAARLAESRTAVQAAIKNGLPTLGICLGMQLLFESSEEGPGLGLGVIDGHVERLATRRLPQIGWNTVEQTTDPVLGPVDGQAVYYANSFACRPNDTSVITAWSEHDGVRFPAAVRSGSSVGVQFHPEKSSKPGLALLGAFLSEVAR